MKNTKKNKINAKIVKGTVSVIINGVVTSLSEKELERKILALEKELLGPGGALEDLKDLKDIE